MGTTFYNATFYKNGKVDRKAECDAMLNCTNGSTTWTVLKSAMKGAIYYAAVERIRNSEREVYAVVFKTFGADRNDPYYNFGYKDMDETMLPCYYDCPKSILDLLTPTDNERANEWRRLCSTKKSTKLKDLPIGTRVIWTRGSGAKVELVKHEPAFQYKTWFWYCPQYNCHVKKTLINDNNVEIIA